MYPIALLKLIVTEYCFTLISGSLTLGTALHYISDAFFFFFLVFDVHYMQSADLKLGTLMGVFVPCLQNILGIIYYIRFSW